MKYISNDELERHWYRYKTEYEPCGQTLERYCWNHKISVKAIENWRRHTKFQNVVAVEVEGIPTPEEITAISNPEPSKEIQEKFVSCKHRQKPEVRESEEKYDEPPVDNNVRILVSIRMSNGFSLLRKGINYPQLKQLVLKLEDLC